MQTNCSRIIQCITSFKFRISYWRRHKWRTREREWYRVQRADEKTKAKEFSQILIKNMHYFVRVENHIKDLNDLIMLEFFFWMDTLLKWMAKEAKKSMCDSKIIRSTFEAIAKIGKILVKANTPFPFAQLEFWITLLFFFWRGGGALSIAFRVAWKAYFESFLGGCWFLKRKMHAKSLTNW